MRSWLAALLLALFGFVASLPSGARAQDFSDIYFFGDSLSDTGNGCSVLQIFGYAPGRCSNGDVWSDYLADDLGFDAEAAVSGGNNYANGGATTGQLDTQIGLFDLWLLFQDADPDALYVVWIGGNDVLDLPTAPGAMQLAVDDLIAGLESLKSLGARNFLIPNLPDVGRAYGTFSLPAGSGPVFTPAERDLASSLSAEFNSLLAIALAAQSAVTIFELDVAGLVEEIFADPASFSVVPSAIDTASDDTDFGIPCLVDGACSADPQGAVADQFLFFDAIHPSTAIHAVIGQRAATLVPEPAAWTLQLSVLVAVATLSRMERWSHRGRFGRAIRFDPNVSRSRRFMQSLDSQT